MPKNITLSIPDDLSAQMDALAEVNWSAVARQSIEDYVNRRKDPDIAPIIEKIKKEKDDEYQNGSKRILESIQNRSYDTIEIIIDNYHEACDTYRKNRFNHWLSKYPTIIAEKETESDFEKQKYTLMQNALIASGILGQAKKTKSFLKGMYDAIFKIWENVKEPDDD